MASARAFERVGDVVVAGVEVGVGQLAQRRRVAPACSGAAPLQPHRLLEHLDRLGVARRAPRALARAPSSPARSPRCSDGSRRRCCARGLARQPLGLVELRLVAAQQRRARPGSAPRRRWSSPREPRAAGRAPCAAACRRASKLPELLVDAAERLVQLGLHGRLAVERSRLLHAAVEQRHDAQARRPGRRLVAALEEAQHEALDALACAPPRRARRSRAARAAPCRTRPTPTTQRQHAPPPPAGAGGAARTCRAGSAARRAAPRAARRAGSGRRRGSAPRRAVAARRIRVHRGQAQHVEVGPRACRWPHAGEPLPVLPRRSRRPLRLLLEDDRARPRPASVRTVERQPAGQQLVEHARRARRRRCARRPARRESARARRRPASSGAGRCASDRPSRPIALELLGDAEVEQLHRAVARSRGCSTA